MTLQDVSRFSPLGPRLVALVVSSLAAAASAADFTPGDVFISEVISDGCFKGLGPPENIWRVDPLTGEAELFAELPPCNIISGLAFTPDGSKLRVSSQLTSTILELDAEGNVEVALDASDGISYPIGNNNIGYDAAGNFYVLGVTPGLGGVLKRFPADGGPAFTMATGLPGLGRIAITPDGYVYHGNHSSNIIRYITPEGNVSVFDTLGPEEYVESVTLDAAGNLYATPGFHVYRYSNGDPDTQELLVSDGALNGGIGPVLTMSPDQATLYAADTGKLLGIDAATGDVDLLVTLPPSHVDINFAGRGIAVAIPEPAGATTFAVLLMMAVCLRPASRVCGLPRGRLSQKLAASVALLISAGVSTPVAGDPAEVGAWGQVTTLQAAGNPNATHGIHSILLHTGKILVLDNFNNTAALFDPLNPTEAINPVPPGLLHVLYCSGHCQLSDGRVMFMGGEHNGCIGTNRATIYTPAASGPGTWSDTGTADEPFACRWYPTLTVLPDGRVLVTDGWCGNYTPICEILCTTSCGCTSCEPPCVCVNTPNKPTIYDPATNSWTALNAATYGIPGGTYPFQIGQYPMMFVLSSGLVFYTGSAPRHLNSPSPTTDDLKSRYLNTATPGWASPVDLALIQSNSAVMYNTDRVLRAGGYEWVNFPISANVTKKAFTIDAAAGTPVYTPVQDMIKPRLQFQLVVLANGMVMAVGGTTTACAEDYVEEAEIWNPYVNPPLGEWKLMEPSGTHRGHHSSHLLLSDGSVCTLGGDIECNLGNCPPPCTPGLHRNFQIFYPPYFYQGTRPAICAAPAVVHYGQTFNVALTTNDAAASITKVRLIHPGAATHHWDQATRSMELDFSIVAGTNRLCVEAPDTANHAPPGYYMLFVAKDAPGTPANSGSLPSVAHWVRVVPAGISGQPTIASSNPPRQNAFCGPHTPPDCDPTIFRDVLHTGTSTTAVTRGIGASGTPNEDTVQYATISVSFDGTITTLTPADVSVNCTYTGPASNPCVSPCPKVTAVSGSGAGPYTLTLNGAIPPGARTDIIFTTAAASPLQKLTYEYLPGDVDMSGTVASSDALALSNALNQQPPPPASDLPRYDINRSGTLASADQLRLVQLMNGTLTTEPWTGKSIAAACGAGGGGFAPGGGGGGASGPASAGGSGSSLTAAQLAQISAQTHAGCAEGGISVADCQQLLDNVFGPPAP